MKRLFQMATAAVALAGCAGAPVGWGGTDEVLFQTRDTIKIQWDSLTTSEDSVRAKAVAFCSGRPVEAIDASSDTLTMGLVRSKTWRCAGATTASDSTAAPTAPAQLPSPSMPGCSWVGYEYRCRK